MLSLGFKGVSDPFSDDEIKPHFSSTVRLTTIAWRASLQPRVPIRSLPDVQDDTWDCDGTSVA